MKQVWYWLRSFPHRYPWFWRNAPYAIMLGIVLAFVLLAAIPQSACWADCSARDKWCNGGNCDRLVCRNGTGGHIVTGCHWSPSVGACADTITHVFLRCLHSSDCNVSGISPGQYASRLSESGGRTWLAVGACQRDLSPDQCPYSSPDLTVNIDKVDCCSGGGGGGGGCTPEYAPPVIHVDAAAVSPPYPLVIGQDPDRVGFTVSVEADGGEKTNDCSEGPDQANITEFKVLDINLSEGSREWITGDLAYWYPGAHVKGLYPAIPDWSQNAGLNTPHAALTFHFSPLDPGYYEIRLKAVQDLGSDKDTVAVVEVPTYLLETTIVR